MVISISPKLWTQALSGDQTTAKIIRQLLTMIESGKHDIIFEQGTIIEQIIESPEFISFREILIAQFERDFYSVQPEIIVRITFNRDIEHQFTDDESFFSKKLLIKNNEGIEYQYLDTSSINTYLNHPLHIIVENRESDGFFVKQIYKLLTERELIDEENISFIHGGGNTMDSILSSYKYPIRQICIIDSDKKHPEDSLSEKVTILREICIENNFKLFVFSRREIENYLPDDAIKNWLSLQRRDQETNHQYFLFEEDQKAFFDLKKGLKIKDFYTDEIKELYNDIFTSLTSEDLSNDKKIIIEGFGRDVWEAYNQVSSSSDFCINSRIEFSELIRTIDILI